LFSGNSGAVGLHDFGQHARGGRRHFQHDLVGFDLDQDLIDGDHVAGLLLPLQQGRFGNRLGQLRDFDFNDRHLILSCIWVCHAGLDPASIAGCAPPWIPGQPPDAMALIS
jgi:hypothetical protein